MAAGNVRVHGMKWFPMNIVPLAPREWKYQDFTRSTRCPKCGQDVFFIRHNGGSVWVDELGWPWPKHGCFDEPHTATSVFANWSVKASGFENSKLGVVTCIRPASTPNNPDKLVEIKLSDEIKVGLFLRMMPEESALLGALVCISIENKLMLHERLGEIAFHQLVELSVPTSLNAIIQCSRCNAFVITKNMEMHKKVNCTNPEPQK